MSNIVSDIVYQISHKLLPLKLSFSKLYIYQGAQLVIFNP